MAEVLDITHCAAKPLTEALAADGCAARALLFEGGAVVPGRPMLWPCSHPDVEANHLGSRRAADVELHVISDVEVGGYGAHVRRGNAYVYADGAYPNYIRQWMERDTAAEYWAFADGHGQIVQVPQAFSLIHYNLVYGHWLLEMLPKLFMISDLAAAGVQAPIILPSTAPDFIREAIEDIVPGQSVISYDPGRGERLAVEQLLLPGAMQWEFVFHPELNRRIDAYVQSRSAPVSNHRMIFVSRALKRDGSYRQLENAFAVEAAAARLGIEIVHAETLTWREKIELFGNAGLIVGEFGSGLINAMFSPAGAKVVALNWVSFFQSRVANFRAQDLGYILDPDGHPRTYSPELGMQGFTIDVDEFRRRLEPLTNGAPRVRRPGAWKAGARA